MNGPIRLSPTLRTLVCLTIFVGMAGPAAAQKVFINERWPIKGPNGTVLSPPHVEPTNECATSVYVDSFVPHATITVFLNGTTIIGGPAATEFGFAAIPLTQALHQGDQITATQTVNTVVSAPSAVMIVGAMPTTLPAPTIDPTIYACGQTVPVHNLVSGVKVEVRDVTAGSVIGNGATPNLWGSDWDPVFTSALVNGHLITATQSACTGVASPSAAPTPVQPEPSPVNAPILEPPIVGNDAITAHGLYTGSVLKAFQGGPIGTGITTGGANWMHVAPPIASSPAVTAEQDLCTHSPPSTPQTPVTTIPRPTLVGPICPGQPDAIVRNTTINATLVLLKNGAVVGYGGAAPGDVPLDIAPPAAFVQNDSVRVAEYIGNLVSFSNTVVVGCTRTTTYHNDQARTGWNASENTLTAGNVRPASFGLIASVALDDQVDTQPLVVTNQKIDGKGVHSVVYVATEGNTVYALDSWDGTFLKSVNLGAPVPTPLGCGNNGPNVGINGTPTIDVRTRTLYVIAYTLVAGKPTYRLHALDLGTLADKPGSPITVAASHTLTNGTTFNFDASVQRQRSALLLWRGNVYAAFASFCDFKADQSRGWLLGWKASNLAPLAANKLTDTRASAPTPFFLSSIWMSGYGVAADATNLFFVTGNSDFAGNTYTGTTNIQESVVKMPPTLTSVADLFTPSNVFPLDQADLDYASGGVMVVPNQPGPMPHLAVAAGKDGRMFVLNRDNMGGFHTPDVPKNVAVGGCWCGPSYYRGSDGIGRVVSSGGDDVKSWKIDTTLSPALTLEASASLPATNQDDGGFFTSVSSRGTTAGTAVIWAVARPSGDDNHVTLIAFNGTATGTTLPQLWSGVAGTWPNVGGNANIVPTVANARVYVGSYKQLTIFGLRSRRLSGAPGPRSEPRLQRPEPPERPRPGGSQYWGTIRRIDGPRVTIALRTGALLEVDLSPALKERTTINPIVGQNVSVTGTMTSGGTLEARVMWRAKGRQTWGEDVRQQ